MHDVWLIFFEHDGCHVSGLEVNLFISELVGKDSGRFVGLFFGAMVGARVATFIVLFIVAIVSARVGTLIGFLIGTAFSSFVGDITGFGSRFGSGFEVEDSCAGIWLGVKLGVEACISDRVERCIVDRDTLGCALNGAELGSEISVLRQ